MKLFNILSRVFVVIAFAFVANVIAPNTILVGALCVALATLVTNREKAIECAIRMILIATFYDILIIIENAFPWIEVVFNTESANMWAFSPNSVCVYMALIVEEFIAPQLFKALSKIPKKPPQKA